MFIRTYKRRNRNSPNLIDANFGLSSQESDFAFHEPSHFSIISQDVVLPSMDVKDAVVLSEIHTQNEFTIPLSHLNSSSHFFRLTSHGVDDDNDDSRIHPPKTIKHSIAKHSKTSNSERKRPTETCPVPKKNEKVKETKKKEKKKENNNSSNHLKRENSTSLSKPIRLPYRSIPNKGKSRKTNLSNKTKPSQPSGKSTSKPKSNVQNKMISNSVVNPPSPFTTSLIDAQESGEMIEHMDEAIFAMDGLKKDQSLPIIRSSLITMAEFCCYKEKRSMLRIHGLLDSFIDSITSLPTADSSISFATSAILFLLSSDGLILKVLSSKKCIIFLLRLLKIKETKPFKNQLKENNSGSNHINITMNDVCCSNKRMNSETSNEIILNKLKYLFYSEKYKIIPSNTNKIDSHRKLNGKNNNSLKRKSIHVNRRINDKIVNDKYKNNHIYNCVDGKTHGNDDCNFHNGYDNMGVGNDKSNDDKHYKYENKNDKNKNDKNKNYENKEDDDGDDDVFNERSEINVWWLSLLTLKNISSLFSSDDSIMSAENEKNNVFKNHFREVKGLNYICDVVHELANEIMHACEHSNSKSKSNQMECELKYQSKLRNFVFSKVSVLLHCMYLIENLTMVNKQNQSYVLGIHFPSKGYERATSLPSLLLHTIISLSRKDYLFRNYSEENNGFNYVVSSSPSSSPSSLPSSSPCPTTTAALAIQDRENFDLFEFNEEEKENNDDNGDDDSGFVSLKSKQWDGSKRNKLKQKKEMKIKKGEKGENKEGKNRNGVACSTNKSNNDVVHGNDIIHSFLSTSIRVLLNLTHDNEEGCNQMKIINGIEIILQLTIHFCPFLVDSFHTHHQHHPSHPPSPPHLRHRHHHLQLHHHHHCQHSNKDEKTWRKNEETHGNDDDDTRYNNKNHVYNENNNKKNNSISNNNGLNDTDMADDVDITCNCIDDGSDDTYFNSLGDDNDDNEDNDDNNDNNDIEDNDDVKENGQKNIYIEHEIKDIGNRFHFVYDDEYFSKYSETFSSLLALLVNLIEKDEENRKTMVNAKFEFRKADNFKNDPTGKTIYKNGLFFPTQISNLSQNQKGEHFVQKKDCILLPFLPFLCRLFVFLEKQKKIENNENVADDRVVMKKEMIMDGEMMNAERQFIEFYVSILLAFLSQTSQVASSQICTLLPNNNFSSIIPVLESFLEFHSKCKTIPEESFIILDKILFSIKQNQ